MYPGKHIHGTQSYNKVDLILTMINHMKTEVHYVDNICTPKIESMFCT